MYLIFTYKIVVTLCHQELGQGKAVRFPGYGPANGYGKFMKTREGNHDYVKTSDKKRVYQGGLLKWNYES